ncbi:SagB/ThcOx family dehydrogenase [Pseudomonas sp. UBA2684]|uniref:SagB/ThcOx family dehydrogenase n=1 Tax=Pseudomonas sp. UBA2684 TaxID=1947311 RepID=UPI000E98EF45|nr:SagB/ThcOx family dehydrogenase [Pseudomonas sp. UBA2684]HBX56233.1 SagB-type dehydrogenase [Pseudomonas sp.]|tara:strand:- start:8032 stop:9630 length:1599 start_codon:yes stop_codon:yes gene_type:complete
MSDAVRAYHQLSKHRPGQFAAGPGQLDWATQPAPFRRYAGTRLIELWQRPQEESPAYDALFAAPLGPPAPCNRASISQLLYDSLGLSAWKEAGGSRWALRVNPSSGNLHPTEAYLLLPAGSLEDGALLAHYCADAHALEVRAELPAALATQLSAALPAGGCLLALASIPWREAWKYGERAYRYCQHDLGHALAAVAIAASALGWQVRLLRGVAEVQLDAVFGLDRDGFHEAEHSDCLLWIGPPQARAFGLPAPVLDSLAALELAGTPNRLSRQYREWPELARVQALCRAPALPAAPWLAAPGRAQSDNPGLPLRPLLHRRRSAQAMDGQAGISAELLYAWLQRVLPANSPVPFALSGEPAQVDLLLFVHRVQGLMPGLYWLARVDGQAQPGLREDFSWQRVHDELPLYRLLEGDARGLAAFLSCGQDIASDGCVALAMLARFDAALADGAWRYPRLYWECGQIGQLLYLEAEAAGLSATGIGCYFDDALHELLGLADSRWQSLYHFTLGRAVWDERLTSLPAYEQPRRPPQP